MPGTQQLRSAWAWLGIGIAACTAGCSADTPHPTAGPSGVPVVNSQNGVPAATGGTMGLISGSPSAGQTGNIPPNVIGSAGVGAAAGSGVPPVLTGRAGTGAMPPPTVIAGAPATAGMGAAAGSGAPLPPPTPRGDKTCLKPGSGNYSEPGPYPVAMKEIDLGMIASGQHTGKFTIYYPNPLESSCLHPIVAWGNGTGVQGAGVYAFFNSNAASWGMVVAEAEEDNTGGGAFHKAGIDYLLKQNEDSSSMFFHKLSTRAGVSGHSQGGFGASVASAHPNVQAAVVVGATAAASDKVSVLVLTGTEDIVMNGETLVNGARGSMFVGVWDGGDHVTTETVAGYLTRDKGTMQMQRLYAAWFRCFLADDKVACNMFAGGAPDNCGICKEPGWAKLASAKL